MPFATYQVKMTMTTTTTTPMAITCEDDNDTMLLQEYRTMKNQMTTSLMMMSSGGDDDDDVEWILCYVHVNSLIAHPSSSKPSNNRDSSVSTKCILPFRRSRLQLLLPRDCGGGMYFAMPEKKALAAEESAAAEGEGDAATAAVMAAMPPSWRTKYHHLPRHTTVMQLMRHGLDGVIAPMNNNTATKSKDAHSQRECESAVPFFVKDLAVDGIYYRHCHHHHHLGSKAGSSSSSARKKSSRRKRTAEDLTPSLPPLLPPPSHPTSRKNHYPFHPAKAPSFENICGSIYVGMMHPVSIPPLCHVASAAGRGGAAATSTKTRRGRKKQPWFMALRGTEVFTVHGNLVLKKRGYGTSVKFMVNVFCEITCCSFFLAWSWFLLFVCTKTGLQGHLAPQADSQGHFLREQPRSSPS